MTISINQVKNGIALNINNAIFLVTSYDHVKPGKGAAFIRVKLKNIQTGQVLEKTFRSSEKLDDVELEESKLQYLYKSGDGYHFMDLTSYEETVLDESLIEDEIKFLQDNLEVVGLINDGKVLKIQLPIFIIAEISHTEPGFRGDTSKSGYKPATIDTGASIQVPLFIEIGERIKIDTRSGDYVERVKK